MIAEVRVHEYAIGISNVIGKRPASLKSKLGIECPGGSKASMEPVSRLRRR